MVLDVVFDLGMVWFVRDVYFSVGWFDRIGIVGLYNDIGLFVFLFEWCVVG